jgi:hypothetical protein
MLGLVLVLTALSPHVAQKLDYEAVLKPHAETKMVSLLKCINFEQTEI